MHSSFPATDAAASRPTRRGRAPRLAIVLAALVTTAASDAPPDIYRPGWSAVHADAANSDYHPRSGPADVALAWSRDFGGMINLGPTSDGEGRVYVTTSGQGCRLHALDRATGKTIWCSSEVDRLAVASSPLLDGAGNLYHADGQAMRSFDRDGRVRWRTPIIGVPLSAQYTADGHLVFVTNVGVLYRLRRDSGRPVTPPYPLVENPSFDPAQGAVACMRGTPECPSANTPAVDLRTGRLFFTFWTPGASSAGVRAMRLAGAAAPVHLWTNDTLPGGSAASPTLSGDGRRLYLTDNEGGLLALDAATGRTAWRVEIGYAAGGSPSLSPDGLIMPSGGRDAPLLAVRDRGTRGEVVWRRPDLVNHGIATQAAGGRAYATLATGQGRADLAVIDTATGKILDRERLPGTPLFTVGTTIDLDGTIYVPTIGGELHAFRAAGAGSASVEP